MIEFTEGWIDEWGPEQEHWFRAARSGKTAIVMAALREHVEQHGTKSVLICSTAPAAVALGQELGVAVIDPMTPTRWRSIFRWPQ